MKRLLSLSAALLTFALPAFGASPVVAPCGDLAAIRPMPDATETPAVFRPATIEGRSGPRRVTLIPAVSTDPEALAQRLLVRVEDEARGKRYCFALGLISLRMRKLEPLGFSQVAFRNVALAPAGDGQLQLEVPYFLLLNEMVPGRVRLLLDLNGIIPSLSVQPDLTAPRRP